MLVAANPCRDIGDTPTRERERMLSASSVPVQWAALDKVHPVKATALRVVFLTGQRPGEVTHIRNEHIRDGWWEMPERLCPSWTRSLGPTTA